MFFVKKSCVTPGEKAEISPAVAELTLALSVFEIAELEGCR